MLLAHTRPAIATACTVLVAATLMVTGCGRSAVDPAAPGPDAGAGASPDPGAGPGTDPGTDPGGGVVPAPGGGSTGGGGAPAGGGGAPAGGGGAPAGGGGAPAGGGGAPAGGHNGFRPLPKITPVPAFKIQRPAAPDPGTREDMSTLLNSYGYRGNVSAPENIQMQLTPLLRLPQDDAQRLHWASDPTMPAKFQFHMGNTDKESWPPGMTFQQWLADGMALAQRTQNFSFVVARSSLYTSILANRYSDTRDDQMLIFYKRLNNTRYAVTYRADGTIDDYCAYDVITDPTNVQLFLALPAVFYQ